MNLRDHIRIIRQRWPGTGSNSTEQPVFLLAAGWRCGSTLLQRMLMPRCLVWGEPFGRAMPIDAVARPLEVFTERWPAAGAFLDAQPRRAENLTGDWVANLYPPIQSFVDAQVHYMLGMFQSPAAALGYTRWGLKEVRLSVDHAAYLNWLFPRARFVFLYRDPYAAYRSFLALKVTYVRWPDEPIDTPERFGRHWHLLAEGFVRGAASLGGVLLKYEDLCSAGFDPGSLNTYLGLELNMAARDTRVGASPRADVSASDWRRLESAVEPLASELGYRSPEAVEQSSPLKNSS